LERLLSLEHQFQPPAGTFEPDLRLAWWRFKELARLVDEDYDARLRPVRAAWSSVEERVLGQQAATEAEAQQLWQKDCDAARAHLTRYCAQLGAEAFAQAERLCTALGQRPETAAGR